MQQVLTKPLNIIRKLHWKELLALLFLLTAIYFFRQQRAELIGLWPSLTSSDTSWVITGIVCTGVYILLQAGLYVFSFLAVKGRINWAHATELFLKRNLISIFLPAGGISSLAYLPANIRKAQVHKHQVHQASAVYGFIGIFSVFIVAIPVLIYLMVKKAAIPGAFISFAALTAILVAAVWLMIAIRRKGKLYQLIIKGRPKVENFINETFIFDLNNLHFRNATIISILIEVIGIAHIYIAMLASGLHPSLEAAVVGYIVATIFLVISPFLRGLGAIELSLAFILEKYGYSTLQALQVTLLFRFFEFWLPLVFGILSFISKGRHLFLRLLPPVLIFLLGVVNIFSVLTPPIISRVRLLREYIPLGSVQVSNIFIILIGLTLIVTANFLFRGLRAAWIIALLLSFFSSIGNITKALDYEEATLSLLVCIVLIATAKQYRIRSNPKLMNIGIVTGLATFVAVLIFGTIGFYFLNTRHFGIDFSKQQSFIYAVKTFVLLDDDNLHPKTRFAHDFLIFIRILGMATWAFFFYSVIRPAIYKPQAEEQNLEKAKYLLSQYGDSAIDYFKIAPEKILFTSDEYNGFISYRTANNYAIVLEEPVCAEENKFPMIKEFEYYCSKKGLFPVYYRVDEESLYYFDSLKKRKILIGQEAILELQKFTLEGKDRKSLRNALNSIEKKGYKVQRHKPPLSGALIQALQQVSDEWLQSYELEETVFSQGMFNKEEIKQLEIISLSDAEEKVVGFLNIIPDYAKDECTYDLIRKTNDAPGGCMDVLIIDLIKLAKERGFLYLNLGMVPMSGIDDPDNLAERIIKYAYEKMKRFSNYQGLRDFKEKYATEWQNKYLVYQDDFNLVRLPAALNKVMQPVNNE